MAQTIEPIEAVIISGFRKGQIVRLPQDVLAEGNYSPCLPAA